MPAGICDGPVCVKVSVGVLDMPTVAGVDTERYAKPSMPVAPMTARRPALCSTGAGEGDVLSVKLSVAEPPVVAGKATVTERPPVIGASVVDAGAEPTATEAVVEAGKPGVGVGVCMVLGTVTV